MIGTKEVRNFINGSPIVMINEVKIENTGNRYRIYVRTKDNRYELVDFTSKIDEVLDWLVKHDCINENMPTRRIKRNYKYMLCIAGVLSMYIYILIWWVTNDRLWIFH